MFTVEERDRVRGQLIEMARSDARIVAGAEVGSLVSTVGDRWSDLDLTFGVDLAHDLDDVFGDWTAHLAAAYGAVRLFDLDSVRTRYRVFLFPGGLQVDLSLTPGAVAQMGPKLRPLFGTAIAEVDTPPHDRREVFGLCVHHALRARLGIERGRLWSAEYYVAELRNETLALACLRRDLPSRYARGFDALPLDVRVLAQDSLVRSLEPADLLRALRAAIALLVAEAGDVDALAAVRPTLDELGAPSLARA